MGAAHSGRRGEGSGQRGDSIVRAHSASDDARERADATPKRARRRALRAAVAIVLLAIAAGVPAFAGEFWITLLTQIMIFGLLALSTDLLLGHAGLFSLCHASFFAVAAYTTAILQVRYGVATVLAAPAGILAGTMLALHLRFRRAHARRLLHPDHARVRLHRLGRRLSLGLVHRRRQRRDQRAVSGDRLLARDQRDGLLLRRAGGRAAVRRWPTASW